MQCHSQAKAHLPFDQHQHFGRELINAFNTLVQFELALRQAHKPSEIRRVTFEIKASLIAINRLRNEAENLLCATVPAAEHACNVCAVYYGPAKDQA